MLYSTLTRSHSFSKPVPLDCELHKYFSVFFSLLRWDRIGQSGLKLGVSLLSGQLGSDDTPAD